LKQTHYIQVASLFSKPEPPLDPLSLPGASPSLPPPECVPPNLCATCANRNLLIDLPGLLPKMVFKNTWCSCGPEDKAATYNLLREIVDFIIINILLVLLLCSVFAYPYTNS